MIHVQVCTKPRTTLAVSCVYGVYTADCRVTKSGFRREVKNFESSEIRVELRLIIIIVLLLARIISPASVDDDCDNDNYHLSRMYVLYYAHALYLSCWEFRVIKVDCMKSSRMSAYTRVMIIVAVAVIIALDASVFTVVDPRACMQPATIIGEEWNIFFSALHNVYSPCKE